MTGEIHRSIFTTRRLPVLAVALLAALLAVLSGGGVDDTAQAFSFGERVGSLEFDMASGNDNPFSIWSNGETLWVLDPSDDDLYAYDMDPEGSDHGDRDSSKDIDLHADTTVPTGIWSDGTTMWVADNTRAKLFAYTLSNGNRDMDKEFDLYSENSNPQGVWSNGTTIWVGDNTDFKLYAYTLSSGNRDSGKEFSVSPVDDVTGFWSDGTTMWVLDSIPTWNTKVYAFTLSSGTRDESKDFDVSTSNAHARGIWSDGATIWVSDVDDDKVYAYDFSRQNPYFTIPASSFWEGVAGTNDRIYLTNSYQTDKIRAFDISDRTEKTVEEIETVAANDAIRGIWTDGAHIWAVQGGSTTVYAYKLSDQSYDSGNNITLNSANDDAYDLWGNDDRLYVVDDDDTLIYAYRRSDGQHISGEDIDLHSDNEHPRGIWSDGFTIWVADAGDEYVYAYDLSDGTRDESREFDLHDDNDAARGLWSDGTYMYVAEKGESATTLYRYNISELIAPTVTLELSSTAISEDGGRATVTATLDMSSAEDTVITVSASSNAVSQRGSTLTIATGDTTTTDTVTLTAVNDDVFTGNRFVAVSGTAVNTEGVTQPADARLVVREDETVPVADFEYRSDLDFDGLSAATNTDPSGIWSDGVTVWVADAIDHRLYAYRMNPGEAGHGDRDQSKEFNLDPANTSPSGVWSDGETVWVADPARDKLFAYRMNPGGPGHGDRDTAKDITLHTNNSHVAGIWSDGETVWVVDVDNLKLYAYRMNPGGAGHGERDSAKEFSLGSGNYFPAGVWSDGETIWVADYEDDQLYAYTLSGGMRAESSELSLHILNGNAYGIWSDGTALWVTDHEDDKLYAYGDPLPTVTLKLTDRAVSENGGTTTVTATLDMSSAEDTVITVSASSNAVSQRGSTLTIATGDTTTTDTVTLTAVNDDVFTGNRFVAVSGTAVNTEGVTQPADARLVVREDETVPVQDFGRWSALDFDGLDAAMNNNTVGFFSDGTTMWVCDAVDDRMYAYRMNPGGSGHGDRDEGKEFDLPGGNRLQDSIWSDGETVWVMSSFLDKIIAYKMNPGSPGHGDRDPAKDITVSTHANYQDMWSDGVTLWILDNFNVRLYAYKMNPGGDGHGDRDADKDLTLDAGQGDLAGVWSDGETIWVVNALHDKLEAYTLSGGTRDASRDLALHIDNDAPRSIWYDGTALWVEDNTENKLLAYGILPPPTVTLELSQRGISEHGGAAVVRATLNWPSTEATTVTVSASSDAVFLAGSTLTIPAGDTTSVGSVVLVGVDDDAFTGSRYVTVSGAAANADGAEGPADVRLVVLEDETVPVENFQRNGPLDFNGLVAATETGLESIWSDGTTMWVGDLRDDELYAYRMNPGGSGHGDRDTGKGFNLHGNNRSIAGIWSDGETIWVADFEDDKLYAYRMNPGGSDHGERDSGKEIDLHANTRSIAGIWSDGETIWVADFEDDKLYAYRMNPGGSDHGERDMSREFDLHGNNGNAAGVWSDGVTVWVLDNTDAKLYAYTLSDGSRDASRELALHGDNNSASGIWSDGTTMWVAEYDGRKLLAYTNLTAPLKVTLAVTPGSISENGGAARVTAKLNRPSTAATTVTVSASSDAVSQTGSTLTIAAQAIASTGNVILAGVDDDIFTGSRFVTVSGAATNTEGVTGPAAARLVVRDDETAPVEEFERARELDFDGLAAATNRRPAGIWSDGVTMWVADTEDDRMYAYRMNPGEAGHGDRDRSKEFNLHRDNEDPAGVWSDGTTMWVADQADRKLYAYRVRDGTGVSARDLTLDLSPTRLASAGTWSDGNTMWFSLAGRGRELHAMSRPHTVTLAVSPRSISENGGVATVTASLNQPSTAETVITVSVTSGDVTLTGDTVTIAAEATASTGSVRVTGVDNDVADGPRRVTIRGSAVNSEGVQGPADITLTVTDDETPAGTMPTVTLFVVPDSISENGGTAAIIALQDILSLHDTRITVSLDHARYASLDSTTLTIPAGQKTHSGTLTVTAVDNDRVADTRRIRIRGSAANSAGVLGPADVFLTIIDDDLPEPEVADNFSVTSEQGKTTFRWRNISQPGNAQRVRYDILVRNPGGSEDDWKFLAQTRIYEGTADRSPLTVQRLPVGETYEFALRAVAVAPGDAPFAGDLTRPITHRVLGPNRPRDLRAWRTLNGPLGPVKLAWEPPRLFPDGTPLSPVMPIPNPNLDTSVQRYFILRADAPADDGDPSTPPDHGATYTRIDTVDNVTTYTDNSASGTGHYFYRVVAQSPDGSSDRSGYAFVDHTPGSLGEPLSLSGAFVDGSIDLSWNRHSRHDELERYLVQLSIPPGSSRGVASPLKSEVTVDTDTVAYTLTGDFLEAGREHGVSVRGCYDRECSGHKTPYSNVVYVMMPSNPPLELYGAASEGRIELSWAYHHRHDEIDGYLIYTGGTDSPRQVANPSKSDVTETEDRIKYTLTGDFIEAGAEYDIFIVGCYEPTCEGDQTPNSDVITVEMPGGTVSGAAVLNLRASSVSRASVTLSWEAPQDAPSPLDHYVVIRYDEDGNELRSSNVSLTLPGERTDGRDYSTAGLQPGTTYSFGVYAVLEDDTRGEEERITVTTAE